MLRTVVVLIAGLWVLTPGSAGLASELELVQKQLEATTAERDALRIELAQAKLKISELEAKLRSIPAPSQDGAAPIGDATAPSPAPADATVVSPSLPAPSGSNRVSHVVKILSVQAEQTEHLNAEVQRFQADLKTSEATLAMAKRRRDSLKLNWYNDTLKKDRSQTAIDQAEAEIMRLEGRSTGLRGQINRLNAQIQDASQTRIITAQDEVGGEHLKIIARGPAAAMAAGIQIGQRYTVEGIARTVGGIREIVLQTLRAE